MDNVHLDIKVGGGTSAFYNDLCLLREYYDYEEIWGKTVKIIDLGTALRLFPGEKVHLSIV